MPHIEPMLAKNWVDFADRTPTPLFIQPKLDGIRAIWCGKRKKPKLYTRRGKIIKGVPLIVAELRKKYPGITFDGELFKRGMNQEEISGLARRTTTVKRDNLLEYHVFDIISDQPFKVRWARLQHLFTAVDAARIILVPTFELHDLEDFDLFMNEFIYQGYEGIMIRVWEASYQHTRTRDLLKCKRFFDTEVIITGYIPGKGKYKGVLGALRVKHPKKKWRCAVGTGFSDLMRTVFWKKRVHFLHTKITIKWQNTSSEGIPRPAVFVRIHTDG